MLWNTTAFARYRPSIAFLFQLQLLFSPCLLFLILTLLSKVSAVRGNHVVRPRLPLTTFDLSKDFFVSVFLVNQRPEACPSTMRKSAYRERKCADTSGTVPTPWAGHFQCWNIEVEENTHAKKQQENGKETQKKYLSNTQLNHQTSGKQPQSCVDKCEQVRSPVVAARNYRPTIHAELHVPLLTASNFFTQQIITSMKFSFDFLYSYIITFFR